MLQVLQGGMLIDGTGAPPHQATLIVEDNRIAEVREGTDAADLAADAVIYNASGKTITPGLIDAHDHLADVGLDLYRRIATSVTLAVLETAACLKDTLQAGITSVRDANGIDWGIKTAVDRGVIPGPRLVIVVGQISPTGGHNDREHRSGRQVSQAADHSRWHLRWPCGR